MKKFLTIVSLFTLTAFQANASSESKTAWEKFKNLDESQVGQIVKKVQTDSMDENHENDAKKLLQEAQNAGFSVDKDNTFQVGEKVLALGTNLDPDEYYLVVGKITKDYSGEKSRLGSLKGMYEIQVGPDTFKKNWAYQIAKQKKAV